MIIKFYVMDYTGHSTLEFSEQQRAEADATFAELLAAGRTAATRKVGSTDYTLVRSPDKLQDETLFITPLVGG